MRKKRRSCVPRIVIGCAVVAVTVLGLNTLRHPPSQAMPKPPIVAASAKPTTPFANHTIKSTVAVSKHQLPPDQEYAGPLAELDLTEDETATIFEAEEIAIANCMNERGFEYRPMKYQSTEELMPWTENRVAGDLKAAKESGYGLTSGIALADLAPQSESPIDNVPADQRDAFLQALQGSLNHARDTGNMVSVEVPGMGGLSWDTNSCSASARRAVYGDDVEYMRMIAVQNEMINAIDALVDKDPLYTGVTAQWSKCMEKRGFNYDHPGIIQSDLMALYESGKIDLARLDEIEKKVAIADSECYLQNGMGEAELAAQQRAEAKLRSTRQSDIDEMAALLRSALERAQVMAGSEAL